MRGWPPGFLTLATQIFAGAAIFGIFGALFNLAGLRSSAVDFLHKRRGG
jgi:hypothetical protein